MKPRTTSFLAAVCYLFLAGCSKIALLDSTGNYYKSEIWSENGMAFLGGTLLETEGTVAAPAPSGTGGSSAVPVCPVSTQCIFPDLSAAPNGPTLETYLTNCEFPSFNQLGLYYSIHRVLFPSNALCQQALNEGFSGDLVQTLAGQTITRTFGRGPGGNQQQNWRLGAHNGWAVVLYTDYPSGLLDPVLGVQVQGGATVTYDASGGRTVKFLGAHVVGFKPTAASFQDANGNVAWPTIYLGSPAAAVQFDESLSTTAGDIYVTGSGASKTVTRLNIMTQHNIARAIGHTTLLNGQPLTWSSDDCCWPTSGAILTNFTRDPGGPNWASETLSFGPDCGSATYTVYGSQNAQGGGVSSPAQLNYCE